MIQPTKQVFAFLFFSDLTWATQLLVWYLASHDGSEMHGAGTFLRRGSGNPPSSITGEIDNESLEQKEANN